MYTREYNMTVIKSRPYITALGGSSTMIYEHFIKLNCYGDASRESYGCLRKI